MNYDVKEYSRIDAQIKVLDLEFFILTIPLDSLVLSWIFYYIIWNLNSNIPSNFDYKQNINFFGITFVGVGLKYKSLES
jgi:hypothetical protein